MSVKLHTMTEARAAKQTVRLQLQLQGFKDVSLGIGETENGKDYAVVVMVADEATARDLPSLDTEVPVKIEVIGKVAAY